MKIEKFNKIDNVFSYSIFEWDILNPNTTLDKKGAVISRDTSFKKNNIFFAENGSGKSKLVNIFKSLNNPSLVIDKHRDRLADNQEIYVSLHDITPGIEFKTSWNNLILKDKILFFDKQFIESSVHSTSYDHSDTAQRKQQRGKDIVYLGNFAAYNTEIDKINNLKVLISDRNKKLFDSANLKIQGLISFVDSTGSLLLKKRTFIEALNLKDLPSKKDTFNALETDLTKTSLALKDKTKISALKSLKEIDDIFSFVMKKEDNSEVVIDPDALLAFTVSKGVQKTLHKIIHKKEFIKQGLSLITPETTECPFCEQNIKPEELLEIVKDYQEIFNKTFSSEESNVKNSLLFYKKVLEGLKNIKVPENNQTIFDEFKSLSTTKELLPSVRISEDNSLILQTEITLVTQKLGSTLDKIEGSGFKKIQGIIANIESQIATYNNIVKSINIQVEQLKSDANDGKLIEKQDKLEKNIAILKEELSYLEKKDSFIEYFKVVDQCQENTKIIESLERIYQQMKEKIVEEFNGFVTDYFSLIKDFVQEVSPSMEILDISGQASYDRRNLKDPALCGFKIEYNKQDCTATLSEGEKQVIALAFFFARLSKETDKEKIVVLDDPITSFDAGKRKSTAELIKKQTKDYSQLFIFTCDPLFKEFCLKQFDDRNFYYVLKSAGSSAIHYIPKNLETIYSSFESEFKNIDTILGIDENIVIYGQKLRFCLETKIKEDYFGYSEDSLSNMIEKVAGKGKAKFEKLIDNKDKILEIYSYCNTGGLAHYPKDGSTSWNELKDKINQYLALQL